MKCCSRNEKNNTVFHLRIKGGGGGDRGSLKEEGTLYLSFPEKGGGGGGGGVLIGGFTESVYTYQWPLGASDQFRFLGNCSRTPPLSQH